jgi:hypothetical protein
MKTLNVRIVVSSLAAVAIAAGHLFVPDPADAAGGAMFRIRRTYHAGNHITSPQGETYSDAFYFPNSEPNPNPPGSYAPETAIFTPMGGFDFPRRIFHYGTAEFDAYTYSCEPGLCAPGYPVSVYYYSYYNYKGFFRPNNPFAVTQTETLNRSVTSPGFTTTQFGNNYAFGRAGTIQVIPGPNRFGGTMRFFSGLNARGYQFVTNGYPCCEKNYQHFWRSGMTPYGAPSGMLDYTEYEDQYLGHTHIGVVGTRIHTSLTTGAGTPNSPGEYITRMTIAPRTTAPWTTGTLFAYAAVGAYIDSIQISGSDNRTENRELGTLSMVTPWLTNNYVTSFNPSDPVEIGSSAADAFTMKVNFLPEPEVSLLLAAGILGLTGLYRLRR